MSAFGSEVKRLRLAKGLSQAALGDAAGMTQGGIGHLETGKSKSVSADSLFKLAKALGVGCDHFEAFFSEGDATSTKTPASRGKPKKAK